MNRTITVYELLGLIKDGKAPKKIKYENNIYEFTNYDYRRVVTEIERGFVEYWLIGNYNQDLQSLLNEKIEILEENKPIIEKLKVKDNKVIGKWKNGSDYRYTLSAPQVVIINKLNEIIDYINRKEDKND